MDTNPIDPNQPQGPPEHGVPEQGIPEQGPVPPAPAPAKPPKRRGRIIALSAAGLVAVLVILLAGSELYFRNRIEGCLADNIRSSTAANDVDVSFARTPMLLQQLQGRVPSIDININGINGSDGLSAQVDMEGVEPSGDNRIDNVTIHGSMTADGIRNRVSATGLLQNPTVVMNTAQNLIEITGTALVFEVSIDLEPTLTNNEVVLTASNASVMGFGVPDDLAQQLITAVAAVPTPAGLTAQDLQMTDQGMTLTYTGQNVLPADLETGTTPVASCSVV